MDTAVVNRYARAFVDVVAVRSDAKELAETLNAMVSAMQAQPAVVHYFLNPAVRLKDKENTMVDMLDQVGADPVIRRLFLAIIQNNRFEIVRYLPDTVRRLLFERLGMVEVHLTVPTRLDDATRQRFQAAFEKRTGKQVVLQVHENPEILGGAVARIGSTLIDGSLKTNLLKIREKLTGDM